MRKKLAKTAALITCFALVLMYVPMTYAGTHFKYNFRQINIPMEIISSVFFFLPGAGLIGFAKGNTTVLGSLDSLRIGGGDAKTTGSLDSLRIGGGDGN